MERWFSQQSYITQVILIIIPVIGWIIEAGVRISALIRLRSKNHIIGLVVFVIFGWAWVLNIIDCFFLYFKEDLMLI